MFTSVFLQQCDIGTLSGWQSAYTGFLSVGVVTTVHVPLLAPVHVSVRGEGVGGASVRANGG